MSEPHFSVKAVSKRTGLSPHVIRVWERRYGLVKPSRTKTNRRLYSDEDVRRLEMLRRATDAGHSISAVARLKDSELEELVGVAPEILPNQVATGRSIADELMDAMVKGIVQMDAMECERVLSRAILNLGQHGLLERLIAPLVQRIGVLWREGTIMAAHEHFASAVIRDFLARNSKPFAASIETPCIVVATPVGQLHELGAVIVSAAANDMGWRVVYLGTSLPSAEIAAAAVHNRARVVALSIVYPEDDPELGLELTNMRGYLPASVKLIAGGRAASAYADSLAKVGAIKMADLKDLYATLDEIRTKKAGSETPRSDSRFDAAGSGKAPSSGSLV